MAGHHMNWFRSGRGGSDGKGFAVYIPKDEQERFFAPGSTFTRAQQHAYIQYALDTPTNSSHRKVRSMAAIGDQYRPSGVAKERGPQAPTPTDGNDPGSGAFLPGTLTISYGSTPISTVPAPAQPAAQPAKDTSWIIPHMHTRPNAEVARAMTQAPTPKLFTKSLVVYREHRLGFITKSSTGAPQPNYTVYDQDGRPYTGNGFRSANAALRALRNTGHKNRPSTYMPAKITEIPQVGDDY
jgi:hypothetical protein